MKASLQPVLTKVVHSVGVLIELKDDFKNVRDNALFQEINYLLENSEFDMQSQAPSLSLSLLQKGIELKSDNTSLISLMFWNEMQ